MLLVAFVCKLLNLHILREDNSLYAITHHYYAAVRASTAIFLGIIAVRIMEYTHNEAYFNQRHAARRAARGHR